jgi:hypothetical protein
MPSTHRPSPHRRPSGPLRDRLIVLAGTPDDAATVATDLIVIAQLATNRLSAVSYASVTRSQGKSFVTVAASSDLANAVDEAQYADDAGPCLDALDGGLPIAVPEIAATMTWPRFRHIAAELGLQSSLSLPLFAGRGVPVAALNLYSHQPAQMRGLTDAVWSVYEGYGEGTGGLDDLEDGGQELIAGLAGAFAVRSTIQQAMGVVMSVIGHGPHDAYTALCERAAEAGVPLTELAGRLTSGQRW